MLIVVILVFVALCVALAFSVLTGLGDRRRGHALPHTVLAGLFFPVTWTVWYVIDERPYQRPRTSTRLNRG